MGFILVLVDVILNILPSETAFLFCVFLGLLFGVSIFEKSKGIFMGLIVGSIFGAFRIILVNILASQNSTPIQSFLLLHFLAIVGILMYIFESKEPQSE